jgi:hypothetical protein
MPELDFAVVCDYVRAEHGIAHVIAGGIDTITVQELPAGQNMGLWARVLLAKSECDRPHRFEVVFQDADGERLAELSGPIERDWPEGHPPGMKIGVGVAFNFGLALPAAGIYSIEILINDSLEKSIPIIVNAADA